jgi:hypothetical protein
MSRENVETVRRVLEAFVTGVERGDFAAAWDTGDLAADTQWVAFPELDQTTYRGRDGFVEFMLSATAKRCSSITESLATA